MNPYLIFAVGLFVGFFLGLIVEACCVAVSDRPLGKIQ